MRIFVFATSLCALLFGGSFLFWQGQLQEPTTSTISVPSGHLPQGDNIPTIEDTSLVLLFAGDIMLDRGVEYYIRKNQNWKWPFLNVAGVLQQADLVFANLESVVSDKGEKQGSIYSFRADPKTIEGLAFAGFDVVSVANNHSFDYGLDAFGDSLNRLKKAGISPVGGGFSKTEARSPVIKEVKGVKVGFLAYTSQGSPLGQATENTPGIAWVDQGSLSDFQQDIQSAKEKSDILIVSLHFGEEYQKEPSPIQELLSKTGIDAGADLVVGHHPHVVQPLEQYKSSLPAGRQGWIAYSLGNFVFDQGFSAETMEGLLLEVTVEEKQITQVLSRAIRINPSFQPTLE